MRGVIDLFNHDEIHILIDANIALHYRRVDQIDWHRLSGLKTIFLIITPVFFRELEKNKVHNPSKKLRKRAAEYISWLAEAARATEPYIIREGVIVKFISYDPDINYLKHRLLPSLSDDQFIASAIAYRDDNLKNTAIVTADLGLEIKLRSHSFNVILIPEDFRLPEEKDPDQCEIEKLKKELAELKLRLPKLSICFPNKLNHLEITLSSEDHLDCFVGKEMAEIRKQNPKIAQVQKDLEKADHFKGLVKFPTDLSALITGLTHQQIEKYNQELDNFYLKYDNYLQRTWQFKERAKLRFEVKIIISNIGTAPASNVDLVLTFPDFIEIIDFDNLPKWPEKPYPPSRPGYTSISSHMLRSGIDFQIPRITTLRDILNGKTIKGPILDDKSNKIKFWLANIKHNFNRSLDRFIIGFRSRQDVHNFSCVYEIFLEETPTPVKDELHFIINKNQNN
jgi:hypothetical protein